MTDLQKLIKEKTQHCSQLFNEIHELRKQLEGNCDHSEIEPYMWEHDNGYGRQTSITGSRCMHCLFVDLWNRKHFVRDYGKYE